MGDMNIRWPLWLPTPTKEGGFFAVQVIALLYLLLGHFSNLPLIPSFEQMPVDPIKIYFWSLAISCINYTIIVKYGRNDYLAMKNSLKPCLLTWALFTVIFLGAFYIAGPSVDFSASDIQHYRIFLYSEINMFVVLNLSFYLKITIHQSEISQRSFNIFAKSGSGAPSFHRLAKRSVSVS
jgi:hypothetical protein